MALEDLAKYIEKGSPEAKIIPFPSSGTRTIPDNLCQHIFERTQWKRYPRDPQRRVEAEGLEQDIHVLAMKVEVGYVPMGEWQALVDRWTGLLEGCRSDPFRCSRCGRSHDEVGILLDVAWFDEERTVCWKCWKRLI